MAYCKGKLYGWIDGIASLEEVFKTVVCISELRVYCLRQLLVITHLFCTYYFMASVYHVRSIIIQNGYKWDQARCRRSNTVSKPLFHLLLELLMSTLLLWLVFVDLSIFLLLTIINGDNLSLITEMHMLHFVFVHFCFTLYLYLRGGLGP